MIFLTPFIPLLPFGRRSRWDALASTTSCIAGWPPECYPPQANRLFSTLSYTLQTEGADLAWFWTKRIVSCLSFSILLFPSLMALSLEGSPNDNASCSNRFAGFQGFSYSKVSTFFFLLDWSHSFFPPLFFFCHHVRRWQIFGFVFESH